MKKDIAFKYLLDPIFILSSALYAVNKISHVRPYYWCNGFFKNYLNDVLLVPVMIPVILFFLSACNVRKTNSPPMIIEIVIPLIIWSIAFELIGPFYFGKGTSDLFDVYSYVIGGFLSWKYWNWGNDHATV